MILEWDSSDFCCSVTIMVDSTYLRDMETLFLLCMLVYGTLDLSIFQLAISHDETLYRVTKLRLYNMHL